MMMEDNITNLYSLSRDQAAVIVGSQRTRVQYKVSKRQPARLRRATGGLRASGLMVEKRRLAEGFQLASREGAGVAFREVFEKEGALSDAAEGDDLAAGGFDHATHLAVTSFPDGDG